MIFSEFKNTVKAIKKSHPIWFGLDSDVFNGCNTFVDIESVLGTQLPQEYKDFIAEYGGGHFAFTVIFSCDLVSDYNIVEINKRYQAIEQSFVLFSENGLGDFYGFQVIDGSCSSEVYFYDHETCVWQETRYKNLFEYIMGLGFC